MIVAFFSPDAAEWLFGAGVVSIAAVPVAGGTMTFGGINEQSPEYFKEDISQRITQIEPSKYPFDTLLRHLGNDKPAINMTVQFEEDGYYERDGAITAASGNAAQQTWTLTNDENFNVDDILMVPSILVTGENSTQMRLQVQVASKTNNEIVVVPLGRTTWTSSNAKTQIPTITVGDGVPVFRITNSKTETAAQTTPKAIIPSREWNYAQIQMAQLEESMLSQRMRAKSGHKKYNANNVLALYNFRSECEYAAKFGVRDTGMINGDQWWTMNGFDKYVTKEITYTKGAMNHATWVDWTKEAFSDVRGSDVRHLLCDRELMADILKVDEVQKRIDANTVEVVRGIKCRRIETDFGTIMLTFDRSLQEIGMKHYGMLVDPANVQRRVVEPIHTKPLELDKTGVRRVKATRLLENYSLEVRVPDSHAIFRGLDPQ